MKKFRVRSISIFVLIACINWGQRSQSGDSAHFSHKAGAVPTQLRMPHFFSKNKNMIRKIVYNKSLSIHDKKKLLEIIGYLKEPGNEREKKHLHIRLKRTLRYFRQISLGGGHIIRVVRRARNQIKVNYALEKNLVVSSMDPESIERLNENYREVLIDFAETGYNKYKQVCLDLYKATITGDIIKLGEILNSVEDRSIISYAYFNGKTLLHIACEFGYFNIIALLLENGVDVNVVDSNKKKPLYYLLENYMVFENEYIENQHSIFQVMYGKTKNAFKFSVKLAVKNQDVSFLTEILLEAETEEQLNYVFENYSYTYVLYVTLERLITDHRKMVPELYLRRILKEYIKMSLDYRQLISTKQIVDFIDHILEEETSPHFNLTNLKRLSAACVVSGYEKEKVYSLIRTLIANVRYMRVFKGSELARNYRHELEILKQIALRYNSVRKNRKNRVLYQEFNKKIIDLAILESEQIEEVVDVAQTCMELEAGRKELFDKVRKGDLNGLKRYFNIPLNQELGDMPDDLLDEEDFINSYGHTLLTLAVEEN